MTILIGMFDSPYVRRVAVSMRRLGMPFEHKAWSVGRDFEQIRKFNPLVRVPTLVLDDGEVLLESAAILDYLDELAGPGRELLPHTGPERRGALRLMSIAIGAADKGRDQIYERVFRPEARRHEPWLERCSIQMHGALQELERHCGRIGDAAWLIGQRFTQADITIACVFTFLSDALAFTPQIAPYPLLRARTAKCESLQEFQATRLAFAAPAAPTATTTNS